MPSFVGLQELRLRSIPTRSSAMSASNKLHFVRNKIALGHFIDYYPTAIGALLADLDGEIRRLEGEPSCQNSILTAGNTN